MFGRGIVCTIFTVGTLAGVYSLRSDLLGCPTDKVIGRYSCSHCLISVTILVLVQTTLTASSFLIRLALVRPSGVVEHTVLVELAVAVVGFGGVLFGVATLKEQSSALFVLDAIFA